MGKIVPILVYGIITIAGIMALIDLVKQPGFGLNNLWQWALVIIVLSMGVSKLLKKDLVEMISVF